MEYTDLALAAENMNRLYVQFLNAQVNTVLHIPLKI